MEAPGENFDEISLGLKQIEETSKTIIKKTLPLMSELKENDLDLIDDLLDEIDNITENQAVSILKNIFIDLTKDADLVCNEINAFKECVMLGEEGLEEGLHDGDIPFMLGVWYGDMYDGNMEINSLKALEKDLKVQLSRINDPYILKQAKELYMKNL